MASRERAASRAQPTARKSAGPPPRTAWLPDPRRVSRVLSDPGQRNIVRDRLPAAIIGGIKQR
eukprot:11365292-Alexandrium_andersonii.AAC.1